MIVTPYADEFTDFMGDALKALQPFTGRLAELISYIRKTVAGLALARYSTTRQMGALQLLMVGPPGITYSGRSRPRQKTGTRRMLRPTSNNLPGPIQSPVEAGVEDDGRRDAFEIEESLPAIPKLLSEIVQQNKGSIAIFHDLSSLLERYPSGLPDIRNLISRSFGNTVPTGISEAFRQSLGDPSSHLVPQPNLTKSLSTGPLAQSYALGSKVTDQFQAGYQLQSMALDSLPSKEVIELSGKIGATGATGAIEQVRQSSNVLDIPNSLLETVASTMRYVGSGPTMFLRGLHFPAFDKIVEGTLQTKNLLTRHFSVIDRAYLPLYQRNISQLKSSVSLVNVEDAIDGLQDRNLFDLRNSLSAAAREIHSTRPASYLGGHLSSPPFMKEAFSMLQSSRPSVLGLNNQSLASLSIAGMLGLDSKSINTMTQPGRTSLSQLRSFSNHILPLSPKDWGLELGLGRGIGLGLGLGLGLGPGPGFEPLKRVGGSLLSMTYPALNTTSSMARNVAFSTEFGLGNRKNLQSSENAAIPFSPDSFPDYMPFLNMTRLSVAGFSNIIGDTFEDVRDMVPSYIDIQRSLVSQIGLPPPALQPFQPILQSPPSLIPKLPSSVLQPPAFQPILQSPPSLIPKLPSSVLSAPAIMGLPIAAGISNAIQNTLGYVGDSIPSYTDIQASLANKLGMQLAQEQLALPNGFKKLGRAGEEIEDSLSKLSTITKNEFLIQPLSRRRGGTQQYVQTTPKSREGTPLAYMTIDKNSRLVNKKSEVDDRFTPDAVLAPDFPRAKNFGMEIPFDGELEEHDRQRPLENKDNFGLKERLEVNIERILCRELLKYGVDYSQTGISGRLSPQADNLPENEEAESELRLLKRRIEQILNDQLRSYYGFQL